MEINQLQTILFSSYEKGNYTDDDLLHIIEQAIDYLVLKSVTNTAKVRAKSYNGILKHTKHDLIIDSIKFYKNND